jgi:5'-nucleotidase/UDP-sugar diphosphatase
MQKELVRGALLPLSLVGLFLLAVEGVEAESPVALTILHTNDTHAHLFPFRLPSSATPGSALADVGGRGALGGSARRATLIQRIRAEQAARGVPVWLVDAGDFTDGSAFSVEYHGRAELDAMAAAGYTFGTLGNHELNYTPASLQDLIANPPFPILCANAFDLATGQPLTTPWIVREVGPLRIGLFGLLTHVAADYPAARDRVRIEDEVVTARSMAALLRAQADLVVAISHAGQLVDEKIAAEVPDVDVIVGGHSHSRLPSGELIWHSQSLEADDVGGTVIVQAHQWGGELGRLDLLFGRDHAGRWRVQRYRASLVPVSADLPDDPQVAAVVERYWRPIASRYEEVLGQAAADFTARGDDLAEYNFVADAVRAVTGTEVGLENTGGVRAPLVKGPITPADIAMLDPFDNSVVTFRMAGRELKALLRQLAPVPSGLRYRLSGGELVEVSVGGRPLDDGRVYSVCTNSYVARKSLAGRDVKDTGLKRRDALIAYVRKQGLVRPAYDGRRVVSAGR